MKKQLLTLLCFLACSLGFSKNLIISNVRIGQINASNSTAQVTFDIQWELSWRHQTGNWDAAWVFLKAKLPNGGTRHLKLTSSGYSLPPYATYEKGLLNPNAPFNPFSNPVMGVFFFRAHSGYGNFTLNDVTLDFHFENLSPSLIVANNILVFGLEMAYIEEGGFFVGSGGTETNRFHVTSDPNIPYFVNSEATIPIQTGPTSLSYANNTTNGGDRVGPIPAGFPKGFNSFYMMKYHVSQQEYVDFLNSLTPSQQSERTPISIFASSGTYLVNLNRHKIKIAIPSQSGRPAVYVTEHPHIPISHFGWPDLAAFLDWSGLRPMTELEYEKAGRGPQTPVEDEYAWGTNAIRGTLSTANGYQLINPGTASESVVIIGGGQTGKEVPGECIYRGTAATSFSSNPFDGPARNGVFESSLNTRPEQGKSYFGISELSGQLWDRTVTVGQPNGRQYTGIHGDGAISSDGSANVPNWPTEVGMGFRGGAYGSIEMHQRLSDRLSAAAYFPTRASGNGGRGVRSSNEIHVPLSNENLIRTTEVFKVFPNPAKKYIFVNGATEQDVAFKISNQLGQVVKNGILSTHGERGISIADLPAGMYYLQLSTGQDTDIQKLIIQH
jgi:formylglycine-generating enzyme required for sulfatase activity